MTDQYLDLSIVIIAFNEEKKIRSCLESLPKGCEIILVDSGSTDKTKEISQEFEVNFQTRKFDDYSQQKNAAINLATRRWVFSIDADELMSPALRKSIEGICGSSKNLEPDRLEAEFLAYKASRKLVFFGKTMNFGKTKDSPIRLFRKDHCRFEGAIHEKISVAKDKVGTISGWLDHKSYDDLDDYFEKFNKYTSQIANSHYKNGKRPPNFLLHMLRPWAEFVSRYFFRLGFIDGKAGYTYAFISSLYTYVKYDKLRELYRKDTN